MAQIKAQRGSKGPQVAGDTQVTPHHHHRPGRTLLAKAESLFLPPSPAFRRVWLGFHGEVLLSEIKGGLPLRGAQHKVR